MVTDIANFSRLDFSKHNRYAIYRMLGRKISFVSSSRRQKEYTGIAQRVCRDIFEGHVELTVNGRLFRFKEPTVMLSVDGAILFVYGNVEVVDEGDDALFDALHDSMGETVDEVISRSTPNKTHVMRFTLGPRVEGRATKIA